MVEPDLIEELVPVSHPDVRRLLGIAHFGDPDQAARRMVRNNSVPHLWIRGRIRFSLPALKAWAAERINNSVTVRAEAQ